MDMNNKTKVFSLLLILNFFSSCNPIAVGQKESKFGKNFNPGLSEENTPTEPSAEPQPGIGSSTGFKLTPGAGRFVGNENSAKAVVLPNDRRLVGGQLSGSFSLNKTVVR